MMNMSKKTPVKRPNLVGQVIILGLVAVFSWYTLGFGFMLIIGVSVLLFALKDKRPGSWVSALIMLAAGVAWISIFASYGIFGFYHGSYFGLNMDFTHGIEYLIEHPLLHLFGVLP